MPQSCATETFSEIAVISYKQGAPSAISSIADGPRCMQDYLSDRIHVCKGAYNTRKAVLREEGAPQLIM